MLTHIHIRDFAIIEELALDLQPGMSALTGETGAGKSILVDALGLVLGDRADSAAVRHGASRAEISATFDLGQVRRAVDWLIDHDLDAGDECILRRVISRDGRSKAYVNGSPATLQDLKELGEMLVDLHGQHEHQSLLHRDVQRELLDAFADNGARLTRVAEAYRRWRSLHERLQTLTAQGGEREARVELLRFQVQELAALALKPGEVEELNEEHARLAHAGRLLEVVQVAHQVLYEAEDQSVDSLLAHQVHAIEGVVEHDPALRGPLELLASAQIQLREAADELQRYAERLDLDPARLQWVEQRLAEAHDLARKHRVEPAELPVHLERLQEELTSLDGAAHDLGALQAELATSERAYQEACAELSKARMQAARRLNQVVTAAMQGLGMEGGHLEIAVTPAEDERYSPTGLDQVEFQVSANPGQPVQPLAKVASGGELSRIALAIQMIGARRVTIPTLVFDEVDAGIGGAVAEVVGRQLRTLGADHQVLCVTHLPQVAAQAHHHYQVTKQKGRDSTRTGIVALSADRRVQEIARMLGGVELTAQTLAHAQDMIARAQAG